MELFEKDRRLGGHAHTHTVEHEGRPLDLDSGLLVYNHRTYPHFARLLAELGVSGHPSDMSFSVDCRRFVRMWHFYLAACEAYFATRRLGDLQLVLTRPGNSSLRGLPAHRSVAA